MTPQEIARIKRFPKVYRAAERKLDALKREAERYGMRDLLKPEREL